MPKHCISAQLAPSQRGGCRDFKENGGFICVRGRATTLRGSQVAQGPSVNLGYKSPAPHRRVPAVATLLVQPRPAELVQNCAEPCWGAILGVERWALDAPGQLPSALQLCAEVNCLSALSASASSQQLATPGRQR